MAKTLVAYFSATGTTMNVASRLARVTYSDLFAIVPAVPYTSADLDWRDKQSRSTLGAADPSCRPAIASRVERIEDYDTVFLGFPIWWYVAPAIINTFLESYDLAGKTIILFATSGGSGMGKTASILRACAPDAKIVDGGILNNKSDAELEKFAARYL
ncbi:MAG: flavodoxin [Coriobacteriia bacterium]|nr:flavodoxin [Coriobacteriia bacterium]